MAQRTIANGVYGVDGTLVMDFGPRTIETLVLLGLIKEFQVLYSNSADGKTEHETHLYKKA